MPGTEGLIQCPGNLLVRDIAHHRHNRPIRTVIALVECAEAFLFQPLDRAFVSFHRSSIRAPGSCWLSPAASVNKSRGWERGLERIFSWGHFFAGNQHADRSTVAVQILLSDTLDILARDLSDSVQVTVHQAPVANRFVVTNLHGLSENRVLTIDKRGFYLVL